MKARGVGWCAELASMLAGGALSLRAQDLKLEPALLHPGPPSGTDRRQTLVRDQQPALRRSLPASREVSSLPQASPAMLLALLHLDATISVFFKASGSIHRAGSHLRHDWALSLQWRPCPKQPLFLGAA